jgi:hypothetical protein
MESRYKERVQGCKTEEELIEYLLSAMPVIKEYTASDEAPATEKVTRALGFELKTRRGVQRQDIFKKYLAEVENEFDQGATQGAPVHTLPCLGCGQFYTKIFDEAVSEEICGACGRMDYVQGEEVGFKEEQEMEKHVIYSYKRENHFNEWISQFQAKESTSVPDEVLNQLRSEFKKQKIKDLNEITHEKVKALLKKLDKSKYYEHVPYIATMLSGITPPTMPQALEDKLRLMFHKIQAPFEKVKPANRKNFLSYSFTLYKFCELLGEDEYLPCFPLLKSKEKLYIQDRIWEAICQELSWQFIRSV